MRNEISNKTKGMVLKESYEHSTHNHSSMSTEIEIVVSWMTNFVVNNSS